MARYPYPHGMFSRYQMIKADLSSNTSDLTEVDGAMVYQGAWDASTDSPALAVAAEANKGHYYMVSVDGSSEKDGITDWKNGDLIISNGSAWQKIDNTDQVSSVAGKSGTIVLDTDDVSEGSNEYYTEAKVSANTDVAANTAMSHDGAAQDSAIALKAVKTDAVVTSNADTVDSPYAGTIGAAFDQAEVQAISTLADDLKVKYNQMEALVNELKAKLDIMNA